MSFRSCNTICCHALPDRWRDRVDSSYREGFGNSGAQRLWKAYGRGSWRKLKGFARIQLKDARSCERSYIGMKPMASAKKNSRSNASSRKKSKPETFALCVSNEEYPASLEVRKLYRVIYDPSAAGHDMVRVVDESGDDYLYPADYFVSLRLPASVKLAFARAS
jgi:hypothetical protein